MAQAGPDAEQDCSACFIQIAGRIAGA